MMRPLKAAWFLLLGLVSCSAAEPAKPRPPANCDRVWYASPTFPASEREALEQAAARWNAIAREQFCVVDGDGSYGANAILRIEYGGEYWRSLSAHFGGANVLGVHYGENDSIGIVDNLTAESFMLVALHEFGHAHRLSHTPAPAIMHAHVGTATDFTPLDFEECHRVGACKAQPHAPTAKPSIQAVFW
jgi:hypothetical protein